jgi:hypothetical protein
MYHALIKMVPEGINNRVQTIKCTNNECPIPSVIPKLWTKDSPDFLSDWGRQLGILNVSHFDIQIIQSIQGQSNSD